MSTGSAWDPRVDRLLRWLRQGGPDIADQPQLIIGRHPEPSRLRGWVDHPVPGQILPADRISMWGWHAWDDHPALAIAVRIGDTVIGTSRVGSFRRPDVAEELGDPRYEETGWNTTIDLSDCPVGRPLVLQISVWGDPSGLPVDLDPIPVHIVSPDAAVDSDKTAGGPVPVNGFIGCIDLPVGPITGPVVTVAGWLLNRKSPTASADIVINGQPAGRARLGLHRPDIEIMEPGVAHAPVSGFELMVELGRLPGPLTECTIEVVAKVVGGKPATVLERTVPVVERPALPERDERSEVLAGRRSEMLSVAPMGADDLSLVVFTHDLGYGGGQLWLSEMLDRAGAGRAFPCTLICQSDGPLRQVLEDLGIKVHVTQPYPGDDIEAYEGRITEVTLLVERSGANVALANTITSYFGADVTWRMGIPTVWAIHESLSPEVYWHLGLDPGWLDPSVSATADKAIRGASALVFEAESTRRMYEAAAGPGRTIVVPYGIETSAIDDYRQRITRDSARQLLGINDGEQVVLVMGITDPRKAQIRMAEAFAEIESEFLDWVLVFVGDNGSPYAEELKRYVQRMDLDGRIRVEPVVADTYSWYRASDLLVSASDMESLPRSVLEVMAFGVPILATAIFGLPELITDGENGFLFEPSDLDATIEALRRVLSMDPGVRQAVAEAGRRRVLDSYDSVGYAADILSLLRGLRENPSALPADLVLRRGASQQPGRSNRSK